MGDDLSVEGYPEVFAIGDGCTYVPPGSERPLPGVAPVAIQMGKHVGRTIRRAVRGQARKRFTYFDEGMLATIGRSRAVMQRGPVRMAGTFAWLVWCAVHIWYLAGMRNRLKVLLDWVWHYVKFRPGSRVLTHEAGQRFGEPRVEQDTERYAA